MIGKVEKKTKKISECKKGNIGNIVNIVLQDNKTITKLCAFGLFKGVEVRIIQTYPAFILKIGYTEVAVDDEIASCVEIQLNN